MSMKIKLVKNGIFPVARDADGRPLERSPDTGYRFPGTLQGEGKLVGIPVLFIRTSGCNLRCTWTTESGRVSICDTPYASHHAVEVEIMETGEVVSWVRANLGPIRHVVISGGEPTIQPLPVAELARKLKKELNVHLTLETNGVLFLPELADHIDLFSISPKLGSSDPDMQKNRLLDHPVERNYIRDHPKFRRNTDTLQKYINTCMQKDSYYGDEPGIPPRRKPNKDFQLKFVIARESDMDEIRQDFLEHLSFVDPGDVILMPVGGNPEMLRESMDMTARLAIQYGFRYTPRLQIDLFGDTAGT
jgi:7-carboxy-7-deazaguanine synthase